MTPLKAALAAGLLACPSLAAAAQTPAPGSVDPRIRTIIYNPRQVVTLTGQIGYQMVIEFGPNEKVENISIGDSLSWQVTPNKSADLLFLKPIDRSAGTNMAVITNLHHYAFELISVATAPRRAQTFDLRFLYPNQELDAAAAVVAPETVVSDSAPPDSWNFAYSYDGAKSNVPDRVFDDGHATWFQWPEGSDIPAVFVIGVDGKEALVNHIARGRYFVVEAIAAHFVLRSGAQVTQVYNDAMKLHELGAAAPRARDIPEHKSGLFGRAKSTQ